MDIDRTNKRIIALLEQNARLSAAAIGREIGLSRPAVQERILAMEQSGVIQGYHATMGEGVGLARAVLFIRIAERPCDRALTWLSSLPGVVSVASLAGEWDALATVTLPSVADLSALNDEIAASPLISESRSQIVLKTYERKGGVATSA
ncbi:AsnC family transcriptional regulator [Bradyrhizobium sp. SSBR45G]|uniref:Lrp/AsnC family transcriptional regulator n=1 Tax=unclassified Bradyrhizobium TaxID=2631580 RepID=UPI0023429049|nr:MULTISPECIES: Lrp/AsnC family transcriptional regulator [unclassified Bradyrhizobium]GLH82140.1 AsnC family transcriptional regulator [Bradyrhizobium sp. SSBR45G]GLH89573.1 AsnC family transcriptional regulator [Bradyrhizobium sp. SSBR45R]